MKLVFWCAYVYILINDYYYAKRGKVWAWFHIMRAGAHIMKTEKHLILARRAARW